MFKNQALALFILLFSAPFAPLFAASTLPSTAELPRLQDMLNTLPLPTKAPRLIAEPSLTTATPTDADRIRFTLNSLKIEGVSVYQPTDLLPLFDNTTGQETSVAELYTIAAKLTAKYRNDGYILARTIVPPQDVTSGHVRLEVIEGFVNDIILVGDPSLKNSNLINTYAKKLQQDGPFNAIATERYLLLMNDLPGVTAQSTLKPADVTGASDLVIHLAQTDLDGDINYNNWGTRYIGPRQIAATGSFNNLLLNTTGLHNRLRFRAVQTTDLEELMYLDAGYTMPLGSEGSTLDLSIHHSISRPGLGLDALDTNSFSDGWSATLRHPLKRTRAATHNAFLTFDWKDTEVQSVGNTTTEDNLRVLRLGLDGTVADKAAGINTYRLELSRGLALDGASGLGAELASRQRGVGDQFYKAKLDLARLQRLNDSINLLVAGSGQFSSHALLAAEEFGVGGENYGRGYDNSEIIGDHGVALKTELQFNFETGEKLIPAWQLFFFQDIGAIWNKDLGFGDEPGPRTLASNGLGARFNAGETMTFDFTLANPRTRSVNSQGASGKNPTIFVRLKKRFNHNWGEK